MLARSAASFVAWPRCGRTLNYTGIIPDEALTIDEVAAQRYQHRGCLNSQGSLVS